MVYILYNPEANNKEGRAAANRIVQSYRRRDLLKISIIGLDTARFMEALDPEDEVVICGGDGTLNKFANDTYGADFICPVYLYKGGIGNDFIRDISSDQSVTSVLINDRIKNLPVVRVNGDRRRFINGVGLGIDGAVCELVERKKKKGAVGVSYRGITLRLIVSGYKCPSAKVTVDGEEHAFEHVWMASVMNGRYYGGGVMVAPGQDRESGMLSLVVVHCDSKFKALRTFPKVFTGEHVKDGSMTSVFTGRNIGVEFSAASTLQIDGELVRDVLAYNAYTENPFLKEEPKSPDVPVIEGQKG